jgi:hypothetical protein
MKSKFLGRLVLLCFLVTLAACSRHVTPAPTQVAAWLQDGSIVISRPVPERGELPAQEMLGFIPIYRTHNGTWLSIDTSKRSLALMDGDKTLFSATGQGIERVRPGNYQLLHKQTRPVWYAPDSYFIERKLPVPSQADAVRFRRGALGDFAIFFNKDTPIHNAPVWSDDVGGIRMSDTDITRLYYTLDIGSEIEVH